MFAYFRWQLKPLQLNLLKNTFHVNGKYSQNIHSYYIWVTIPGIQYVVETTKDQYGPNKPYLEWDAEE